MKPIQFVWIVSLGDIGEAFDVWGVYSSLESAFAEVNTLQGVLPGKWTEDCAAENFYAWRMGTMGIHVKAHRIQ